MYVCITITLMMMSSSSVLGGNKTKKILWPRPEHEDLFDGCYSSNKDDVDDGQTYRTGPALAVALENENGITERQCKF